MRKQKSSPNFLRIRIQPGLLKKKKRKRKEKKRKEKSEHREKNRKHNRGGIKKLHFTRNVVFPSGGSF